MKGFTITTPHFDGPFQVLLAMIEEKKLSVSDVTLAHIAEQFFAYIEKHDTMPIYELADFLYIASKLLYAKSRALSESVMPSLVEDEGGIPLVARLRMYQAFVEATGPIKTRFERGDGGFWGRISAPAMEPGFHPPSTLHTDLLHDTMNKIMERIEKVVALPETTVKQVISLKEKIDSIKETLKKISSTKLSQLIGEGNAEEVVVSFLALLELVKQNEITVNQENLFDDVMIQRYGHNA